VKAEVGARAAARKVEENIVAVVLGAELAVCVLCGGRIGGCGLTLVVMRGEWGLLMGRRVA
jgi:hypothetical protein